MSFKPNLSVKEALDHLATRLNPVIAARFAGDLGDHPWTVVLEILDEKRGYSTDYKYWTYDLQAQLRMLTERLGDFGFPFDDKNRTVSTLGNELRIVRKQMAHMHEFSVEEAYRAGDHCVRLIEYFKDEAGLAEARRIRHEALEALAKQEGVTEQIAAAAAAVAPAQPVAAAASLAIEPSENPGTADTSNEAEPELVKPDASVLVRKPSIIGDQRLGYEPWTVVEVGGTEVLDDLPKKAAKEKVRAVALEIGTYEGPIHLDRLVQMTAQSFGLKRVAASRQKQLARQILQAGLFVDADKFLWPNEIEPGEWTEFRPSDSSVDRPFVYISPVEIANAAKFISASDGGMSTADLEAAVLQTFGRRRRTRQVAAHLDKALAKLR